MSVSVEDRRRRRASERNSYNATISSIRVVNDDLWVIDVEPDRPLNEFRAGQYTTLGLALSEPRRDDAIEDPDLDRTKMVKRTYSVACPMIESGELVDPGRTDLIQFYIALVRPRDGLVPMFTPRLATRVVGDRVRIGARINGPYTLDPVDPDSDVLLLATGTGEAPHTAMVAELAASGHRGRVAALTTARFANDFGYTSQHAEVEEVWDRYRYVSLSTRQPADGVKRYVQDVIADRAHADLLGFGLDPGSTHVFLCGNPAMLGVPDWEGEEPVFAESGGTIELLGSLGFSIDSETSVGNVHYEEYW